ncbi:anti-sigma factor [Croceicoccus mobilis]|uniref:Anti-sigma factor n=1 Tax=Croceicoccus mobilis TaxID=1703339 RepID=A0A917DZH1_9SPHN|nr:hypothetical protein [Croceicoccus mobilis]GGD85194.1 hypothetical protein GCM10010990_39000 [Croceicoccus mobilis]
MTVTPEEIAAFADGELTGERKAAVEAAMLADPDIARRIEGHKSLKAMLSTHYAPVAAEPVPDRLVAMLAKPKADVVDLTAERTQRPTASSRHFSRWGWVAGPALAASLVLAVTWSTPDSGGEDFADAQLAGVLDTALAGQQSASADTRILLSFRNGAGEYCRAFNGSAASGIACREKQGWKLEQIGNGQTGAREAGRESDYRMAGTKDQAILQQAQDMSDGPALDAAAEERAMARNWLN